MITLAGSILLMLMVLAGVPIPITLVVGGMLLAIALATEW